MEWRIYTIQPIIIMDWICAFPDAQTAYNVTINIKCMRKKNHILDKWNVFFFFKFTFVIRIPSQCEINEELSDIWIILEGPKVRKTLQHRIPLIFDHQRIKAAIFSWKDWTLTFPLKNWRQRSVGFRTLLKLPDVSCLPAPVKLL